MRPTVLLAALTCLTLAFAGCSDDGGDGDGEPSSSTSTSQASTGSSSSSTTSASATATSSSSTGTGGPANQPPTGSVSVTVNGTNATFTLTGTDPDGDTIAWELDFGDGQKEDGTTLPATVNHTYAAGNYTANFTVTDGKDPKTYDVSVAAVAAEGAGNAPVATMTGTVNAPDPFAMFPGGFCATDLLASEGTAGTAGNTFPVESGWIGLQYTIEPATLLVTFFTGGAFPSGHGGEVPAGATHLIVCGNEPTAVMVDFTVNIV